MDTSAGPHAAPNEAPSMSSSGTARRSGAVMHSLTEVVRENRRPVSRVLSEHRRERLCTGWSFLSASGHPNAPAAYPRLDHAHRSRFRSRCLQPLSRRAVSRRIFGLAPAGVCRAVNVAADAVGSYPTVSPLPRLSPRRSVFCGTFRHPPLTPRMPRRYLATCPVEPGLSSMRSVSRVSAFAVPVATIRPTISRKSIYSERLRHGPHDCVAMTNR